MDIADASTFFDDDPVADGYTGLHLFYAQSASYDDSSSDGATNRRRVISVGPGIAMPARSVLSIYGDRWLVGRGAPDGFQGEVVRQHFTMKRATDLAALLTPNEAVLASAGTSAYVHKHYFKETSETLNSSEIDTFWNVFVAPDEPVAEGSFLRAGGKLFRVRNEYLPVEGLRVCQCDELETNARVSAVFATGAYDPITDTVAAGTTTVDVIKLDTPKLYRFRHISDPHTQKGDLAVLAPGSLTIKPNDTFTMDALRWRVVTVQAERDAKAIHARLV